MDWITFIPLLISVADSVTQTSIVGINKAFDIKVQISRPLTALKAHQLSEQNEKLCFLNHTEQFYLIDIL